MNWQTDEQRGDNRAAGSVSMPDTLAAELESVSLYLHVPFCHAKCHYCDFNSYAGMLGQREAYVDALAQEIRLAGHARAPGGWHAAPLPHHLLRRWNAQPADRRAGGGVAAGGASGLCRGRRC